MLCAGSSYLLRPPRCYSRRSAPKYPQAQARYGRPEIYRISGLGVTPVTDTRAVATFRKHWQWHTSRNRRSSGEEEERITLVRTADAWHISSEQAVAR